MSNIRVTNPFKIPDVLDGVSAREDAARAVAQVDIFVQSFFIVDRGFAFWALTLTCACLVSLMVLASALLLGFNVVKGSTTLVQRRSSSTSSATKSSKVLYPTHTAFTSFTIAVAGISYVLLCIHRFRLDQLLHSDQLETTIVWFGAIWLPLWLVLYFQTVSFLYRTLGSAKAASNAKTTFWRKVLRTLQAVVLRVALPIFVALNVIIPSALAQKKFVKMLPEAALFLAHVSEVLQYWQAVGVSSSNAINVFRRVENDAVQVWKSTAQAYDHLQPIYILWSIYFGVIVLVFITTAAYGLITKPTKSPEQNTPLQTATSSVDDDLLKPSMNFMPSQVNEQPAKSKECILEGVTTVSTAAFSVMTFVFVTFCAVRVPHYSAFADVTSMFGAVIVALSVVNALGGALCLTILSFKLSDVLQRQTTPGTVSGSSRPVRRRASAMSADSDATLA